MEDSTTVVQPPGTLQHGSSSTPSAGPPKKFLIAGGIGLVALLGLYLYSRSKKNAAAAATPAAGTNQNVGTPYATSDALSSAQGSQYYDALATAIQDGVGSTATNISAGTATTAGNISAGTATVTNAIGSAQHEVDQRITNEPTPVVTTTPTHTDTPTALPPPIASPLPSPPPVAPLYNDPGQTSLGGQQWWVLGGGQEVNGQYQDKQQFQVTNGAPVFFTWNGNGIPKQGPPPGTSAGIVAYTPTSTPLTDIQGPNGARVVGG